MFKGKMAQLLYSLQKFLVGLCFTNNNELAHKHSVVIRKRMLKVQEVASGQKFKKQTNLEELVRCAQNEMSI